MEQLDGTETNLSEEVELEGDRSRGVLSINVGEHVISVFRTVQSREVVTISRPHHSMHRSGLMGYHVGNPNAPSRSQEVVELAKC